MPPTSSDEECRCKRRDDNERRRMRSFLAHSRARNRRKRRRSSCDRGEEVLFTSLGRHRTKKCKTNDGNLVTYFYDLAQRQTYNELSNRTMPNEGPSTTKSDNREAPPPRNAPSSMNENCWIQKLPEEILLLIFSYLPLAMLLLVVRHVCKTWGKLAMDWTLWKAVEHLRIKSMVVTTSEVKTLLRTIPKLKKLELVLRNDTEELLEELFRASEHLEVLRLDRCVRSNKGLNIPSSMANSILESCPKLKSVTLIDTYFRSREFYKCLAQRFRTFERINISCTTKSEMDFFIKNLKGHVPGVEFQNVSMMGKADGKKIYWGPILGLVIRPNPTSPYHQQSTSNEFPNYAF